MELELIDMSKAAEEMRYSALPGDEDTKTSSPLLTGAMHHGHSHHSVGTEENDDEDLHKLEQIWADELKAKFDGMPWYRRPSKKLLYAILSLHTLSFTILLGPLMVLMLESICTVDDPAMGEKRMDMGGGGGGNTGSCKNSHSQQTLSNVQSILSLISGVLGFTLSGKFGQLSDVHGRVKVFKLFSVINVCYILGLLVYFEWFGGYNELFMILMVSIGYLNGGIMTLIANGNSYINDLVTAEDRTVAISLLMSFIYSMLGFGPLIGSLAIKRSGGNSAVALYLALGFGVLSMALIFLFMTETRHPAAQEMAKRKYSGEVIESWKSNLWSSVKSFFHPIKRFWLPRSATGSTVPRRNMVLLALIDVLTMSATVGTMHTVTLYTILRYHWSSVEIGYYMSLTGFGKAAVLLVVSPVLMRLLHNKLGLKVLGTSVDNIDRVCVLGSTLFVVGACVSILAWDSSYGAYTSAILQSLAGLISPTIQASVAKYSPKTTVGEMFGVMALLRHLAMLIVPVFFLQVYRVTVDALPQVFLFVALVLGVLAFLAAMMLRVEQESEEV